MTLVSFSDESLRSRYTDTAVPVYARTFTVTLILLYRYTPVPILCKVERSGRFFEFCAIRPYLYWARGFHDLNHKIDSIKSNIVLCM